MILIEDSQLIKNFVDTYYALKTALSEKNTEQAQATYQQLYNAYTSINTSQLAGVHKEIAYQQLTDAYHSLHDLQNEIKTPANLIAIALVVIIISTIIFVNPQMIGLAIFQHQNHPPVWDGQPQLITIHGETSLDLSPHFTDKDRDSLVYLALPPEGIKTSIEGSTLTITPAGFHGDGELEILASDLKNTTRTKIPITVKP